MSEPSHEPDSTKRLFANTVLVAALLTCGFWLLEAAIESILFDRGNLLNCLWSPEPMILWIRTLFALFVFLFSLVALVLQRQNLARQRTIDRHKGVLTTVFEQAADGFVILDRKGAIVFISQSVAELCGGAQRSPPSDIETWAGLFFADTLMRDRALHALRQDMLAPSPPERIFPVAGRDGAEKWCRFKMTMTHEEYIVLHIMDVTEQTRTMETLRRLGEKYGSLFKHSKDMIILYGPDGSIVDANDLVLDHLGYTMPAIRALPAGRLHPAEEQARFDLSIDEACELGSSEYEITFVKKSGERFHAEVSASAYSIQNRTVIQAVVHDATRRRTSEEHLAAEKERMRVTLGSMTEGVISTDNDGRIILMNEVAAQLTGADPREAIGRPVEQVFDPVAPSGETVTENPVRSVLREKKTAALRGRLVAKDRSHRERTISLTAAPLRGGDGTCLGAVVVFCDMTEALIAEEELHKVHVLQSLGLLAGGIAHDFNNFLTSIGINIGLGLATSYSIVRKHDGFMTVESQPDQGTSFAVYLPAVHAGTPPEPQQFAPPASGGGRVLLMDDDDLIRKCALSLFPEIGYRIECVTDGAAALRRFEEGRACGQPFDIVVLDLTIPGGMGGRETARRLLETDPAASIVVSSGYSNDPVLAHYREYGFCDVISKPYEVEKMEKTLATIMERRRTAPQTADAQAGP